MSPNLEKGKDPYDISSYHPLNNLSTIDKVVQEYFKLSMIEFFYLNDIIIDSHHGGRKFFSTTTALSCLMNYLKLNYTLNNVTATIQTDMSIACDTVDHDILLTKFEH